VTERPSVLDRVASIARAAVPARIWNAVARPYRERRFARRIRRSWLTRDDRVDGHVAGYWNTSHQPNRATLVDAIAVCATRVTERPLRVLEFGCHAGMNLRLVRDRLGADAVELYGVEPNHDAAAFVRRELPYVQLLEGDDDAFVRAAFPARPVHVAIVNSVFYCVEAARVRRVLAKLCATTDVVILGEQLDNRGTTTRFDEAPARFAHPYAAWLRALGFVAHEIVAAPEPRPQLDGFLVAQRARR
jgi:hypothetical protein